MTQEDIEKVQQSWRIIEPVKRVTAELFYTRLFELDPALRQLFTDPVQRLQRFIQLLDATVRGLDRADVLMPAVRELGIRHPTFGESDTHHAHLSAALLWTLEKGLRGDFTPQVQTAWIRICGVLSHALRSASLAAEGRAATQAA